MRRKTTVLNYLFIKYLTTKKVHGRKRGVERGLPKSCSVGGLDPLLTLFRRVESRIASLRRPRISLGFGPMGRFLLGSRTVRHISAMPFAVRSVFPRGDTDRTMRHAASVRRRFAWTVLVAGMPGMVGRRVGVGARDGTSSRSASRRKSRSRTMSGRGCRRMATAMKKSAGLWPRIAIPHRRTSGSFRTPRGSRRCSAPPFLRELAPRCRAGALHSSR